MNWDLSFRKTFIIFTILLLIIAAVVVTKGFGCPDDKLFTLSTTVIGLNATNGFPDSASCEAARAASTGCTATPAAATPAVCNTHCASNPIWKCIGKSGGSAAYVGSACYIDQQTEEYYYSCIQQYNCECI